MVSFLLILVTFFLMMMMTHELSIRPQGDEYSYDDYSEDSYYDTPDNYDYGDTKMLITVQSRY